MKNTMRLTMKLDVRISTDPAGNKRFTEPEVLEMFQKGNIAILPEVNETDGSLVIRKSDGETVGRLFTRN